MVSEKGKQAETKTEEQTVPAKDLDNLRATLQKKLAEQEQRHKAELQTIQEAAEQARQEVADLTEVANLEPEERTKLLNFRRVERDLRKREKEVLAAHNYVEQERAKVALERAKAELLKEYPEVSMADIAEAPDIQAAELLALRKTHKMGKTAKAEPSEESRQMNRQETGEAKSQPTLLKTWGVRLGPDGFGTEIIRPKR